MNKNALTIGILALLASGVAYSTNVPRTGPGAVPIGGIIATMPSSHANLWQPPASGQIKDGFMRADRAQVPIGCTDCVFPAGVTLPNMTAKYPRGNSTSGTTGGANTQASNVALSSHAVTQPVIAAHTVTQPTISAHTITQPTFTVNAHYHNTHALTAAGQTHASTPVVSGISESYAWFGGGATGTTYTGGIGTGLPSAANLAPISSNMRVNIGHTHAASAVSGTVGNQGGGNGDSSGSTGTTRSTDVALSAHSLSQNVGVDGHTFTTAVGVSGHSLTTNVGVTDHTVTNNAVNNEPAYVEVVWVIRAK